MAILTKPKSSGGHWYTAEGAPMHEVLKADKKTYRSTTLKDARLLGLFPSVTTILGIMAKPQLNKWGNQQVALSALRNPKKQTETEQFWSNRVIDDAFVQVDQAADLGTKFHAVINDRIQGVLDDQILNDDVTFPTTGQVVKIRPCLQPLFDYFDSKGFTFENPESTVVNLAHGFAGTVDCPFRTKNSFGVMDFKSRKTKKGKPIFAYDGQVEQIAAYGATYWGEEYIHACWGANVYISTTEVGRVDIIVYKPHEIVKAFEKFKHMTAIWRMQNKYDPRGIEEFTDGRVVGMAHTISEPNPDYEHKEDAPPVETSVFDEGGKGTNAPTKVSEAEETQTETQGEAPVANTPPPVEESAVPFEAGSVILPFGKHKGKRLDETPVEYKVYLSKQKKYRAEFPEIDAYFNDATVIQMLEDAK
jgi:hypothetical protein